MAGGRVDHAPSLRQPGKQAEPGCGRENFVPLAGKYQGRDAQAVEPGCRGRGQQPRHDLPPDAGRQSEAGCHGRIEEFGRDRVMDGAHLELPGEPLRHRVLQRAHRRGEIRHPGHVVDRGRRADQHQPLHPVEQLDRHLLGHEAPHGVPHDRGTLDGERVHQGEHVPRELAHRIAAFGPLRVAVTAEVGCDHPVARRDAGEHPAPAEPGIAVAVQEDDRGAIALALLGVPEPDAGGEADVLEPGRCR